MTRRFPTEATFGHFRGRNGSRDIVVYATIPHGKHRRAVEIAIEPEQILALADAIRCCPQHVGESVPVASNEDGSIRYAWRDYVNLGHAVWHMDNPNSVRPCLPMDGRTIDVGPDDRALPSGPVIDVESEEP